jgi:hypothetical protein
MGRSKQTQGGEGSIGHSICPRLPQSLSTDVLLCIPVMGQSIVAGTRGADVYSIEKSGLLFAYGSNGFLSAEDVYMRRLGVFVSRIDHKIGIGLDLPLGEGWRPSTDYARGPSSRIRRPLCRGDFLVREAIRQGEY